MATRVFDDGSTLTEDEFGQISSTPAWDWLNSGYSAAFTPNAANPNASSWSDVLRTGLSRFADYRIASVQAQNTTPTTLRGPQGMRNPTTVGGMGGMGGMGDMGNLLPLLLIGGLIFVVARN